jgi:hypothetical protein
MYKKDILGVSRDTIGAAMMLAAEYSYEATIVGIIIAHSNQKVDKHCIMSVNCKLRFIG